VEKCDEIPCNLTLLSNNVKEKNKFLTRQNILIIQWLYNYVAGPTAVQMETASAQDSITSSSGR
jgi:hypothetical protein